MEVSFVPLLFNTYINNLPLDKGTKHFLYADDLAGVAKRLNFD